MAMLCELQRMDKDEATLPTLVELNRLSSVYD